MVDVLGYETYAIHGTDWGSAVSYTMYDKFNATLGAAHSVFLPFYPPTPRELTAGNITLSEAEQVEEQNAMNSANTSDGYFIEQSTKSNTVGLALHDNPVGQLAWLGEKFMNCECTLFTTTGHHYPIIAKSPIQMPEQGLPYSTTMRFSAACLYTT
jgi:hypothetical protein